jgi:hypothetical protein
VPPAGIADRGAAGPADRPVLGDLAKVGSLRFGRLAIGPLRVGSLRVEPLLIGLPR